MCGGGTDRASRQAAANERARQLAVQRGERELDAIFAAREPQMQRFVEALRGEYGDRVNRQRDEVNRQLLFALARSGLTGGSAAVDAQGRADDEYRQAVLNSERQAQLALARLRGQDQAARSESSRLLAGGAQSTRAAQFAARQMRANLAQAQSQSLVDGLGDLFQQTRDYYVRQREDERYRRGLEKARTYGNPFSGEP